MNNALLQKYVAEFRSSKNVSPDDADDLFDALISSDDVSLIANLLVEWNKKETTEDELFAFASLMRRRMKRINTNVETVADIVGTGGSRAKTFNVSTVAAFVISGAGVPVAKHGNRAATSKSGSFDCLSLLGINADAEPDVAQKCFDELDLCFMFAPRFHFLSPTLAEVRRKLGRPTIFNNLGPLCNPASAPHQIIGVWSPDLIDKTASALARFGGGRSWVVCGQSGLDEIALVGKTRVAEIREESIVTFAISAKDFGIESVANNLPSNCTAIESAKLITEILNNERKDEDVERLVLVNAASAIFVAGVVTDLQSAFLIAEDSLRSGAAMEKLTNLREITKQ